MQHCSAIYPQGMTSKYGPGGRLIFTGNAPFLVIIVIVSPLSADAAASTGAVGSAMSEVKSQLKMDKVMNQQDNEVRELHQWAMGKLQDAQQVRGNIQLDSANTLSQ